MEAYKRFKQNELFLFLKRDLAMVSNLHTHEFRCLIVFSFFLYFLTHYFFCCLWADFRDAHKEAEVEALSRVDLERSLGAFKQE